MDSHRVAKVVGQQLKEWREECELTLDEVAEQLQMSVHVLTGIESGVIRTPEDLLKAFAHLYDVAEQELSEFVSSIVTPDGETE